MAFEFSQEPDWRQRLRRFVWLMLLAMSAGCVPAADRPQAPAAATDAAANVVPALQPESIIQDVRPSSRRAGIVRLTGRAFADDAGPYLGLGATLFWAGWGFQHDRARLEERILAALAGRVDYIRVLGSVGASNDSWHDRLLDPRDPAYDAAITGLTDLAYDKYGLRVEWTIFGGTAATPTPAAREALVRRFASLMRGREHKIQHYEIANEGWHTGFSGPEGVGELRRLAQILRDLTPNIVALTSPQRADQIAAMYEGSAANLVTMHVDRSTNGADG